MRPTTVDMGLCFPGGSAQHDQHARRGRPIYPPASKHSGPANRDPPAHPARHLSGRFALTDVRNDVLVVHGGTPLRGEVRVKGAKNLVSKAMVATSARPHAELAFRRPRIRDVEVVRGLLELHGVRVSDGVEPGELVLDPTNVDRANVDEINVHAGSSRIPILFCGPLLHRLGHAFIPDLGGCHIGNRPDRLPPAGAAGVRRPGRQDAAGAATSPHPTACTAPSSTCPTRASAPPSRCC